PATPEAWVYAAVNEGDPDPAAPPARIVRFLAPDGRSPERIGADVLAPAEAWEGGTVGAPSALRVEGEIWLYYAGAAGIGLAKSADGVTFERAGQVLAAAS